MPAGPHALNARGHGIDTLHVTGGHLKNPLLMELYADAVGCKVVEPSTEDAVLLNTVMVAATAAGLFPSLVAAAEAKQQSGRKRPPNPSARDPFDRDYAVFVKMQDIRRELDALSLGSRG